MSESNRLREANGTKGTLLIIYDGILKLTDTLAGTVLAAEVVLVTINVTGRFVFNHSWGWMDEVCQYMLLWLVTLGTVSLMDRWALFYAEVLLLFIKNTAVRKAIFVFNAVILIVFFAIVFWTGIDYVRATWSFEMDYAYMRKFWFYICMPTWGFLMLIVMIKKLIRMEDPDVTEVDAES